MEQMSRDERLAAQNECQVLKLLSHPNIIEYYENFLEDKALMIAMEYAPGTLTVTPRVIALPAFGGRFTRLSLFSGFGAVGAAYLLSIFCQAHSDHLMYCSLQGHGD